MKVALMYCILIFNVYNANKQCDIQTEVHALILARGGSKGIHNKNLVKINDLSILARTILTIKNSNRFKNIWVSTDSDDIMTEATKYGALVHQRSALLARDTTPSIDSVQEFLNAYPHIKRLALFQCTSVFLSEYYIKKAFELFQHQECVFAVTRSYKLRWKEHNDKIIPLNFNPKSRPRRQDWKGELLEAGMFYFASRSLIERYNQLQNEGCATVIINSQDAIEIDTMADVVFAQCILEKFRNLTTCR